jgi:hypothetical protein
MPNAGAYPYRWEWLKCSRTNDGTTGDRPKTYVSQGYLYGTYELDSSTEQNEFGAIRSTVSGTFHIRQYPEISPLDRLYSVAFDETYLVDGVRWGNNEMIVDVHRLDVT